MVIFIVLMSGCINLPFGIKNLFGGDVVNVATSVEKIGASDVIEIKDVLVLPHPPLLPNQEMTLSILLQNKGDEPVENVYVELYDAPNFHDIRGRLCNRDNGECFSETGCNINDKCQLSPGEERDILFRMLTPNKDKKSRPTLSYSVKYDYETNSLLSIPIINEQEIIKRQRAKQPLPLNKKLSVGDGPIQVEISSKEDFILSGQNAAIVFQIKNKGQGIDIELEKNSVEIIFDDFGTIDEKSPAPFSCENNRCVNNQKITIYNRKSPPLYFLIKNVKDVDVFETQLIRAKVKYTYELRGSETIEVKPYGH
jgi:hypothetical protein